VDRKRYKKTFPATEESWRERVCWWALTENAAIPTEKPTTFVVMHDVAFFERVETCFFAH
jgi:hypothetical protein